MKSRLLILLLLLALTGSAAAAGGLDGLLGAPSDCYYRAYDAAHLDKNGKQRVTQIGIRHNALYQDTDFDLTVQLAFMLRNGETYTVTGLCRGNACYAEGDGGAFKVTGTRERIRLAVDPDRGLGAEGVRDYSGDLLDSDDKVFLLYPAPRSTCDWRQ